MIFATGDTHGNFRRFAVRHFPEQKTMNRNDHIIICGDFGGVWDGSRQENEQLDWLDAKPFTTLWVDGNHENYDMLMDYPLEDWNGGKIQRIRPNILRLMRGQLYDIEGYSFFAMGGASSHDISGGILEPNDPMFKARRYQLDRQGASYRVNHRSWWKEELPSDEEYAKALETLERAGWKVDYVITHCPPSGIVNIIGEGAYKHDKLTDFLDMVSKRLEFHYWLFGHHHDNRAIGQNYILLYEQIVQVV